MVLVLGRCSLPVFATLLIFLAPSASAADRRVPQDYSTIKAAVSAAAEGDRVVVQPGTYYGNVQVEMGITIVSVDPNDPSIVANTVIRGGGGSAVTFSGPESANSELRGFTITGANTGGINCQAGNITIRDCIITNNCTSSGYSGKGGGISADSLADVTVIDCIFTGNTAGGHGGGIYVQVGVLTVIGCEFFQNSAGQEGGAVATDYEQATIRNCVFRENDAVYGGAVHSSHYPATIANCAFTLNSAQLGGAACVNQLHMGDSTQRITNCTFYDNSAGRYGGAVSVRLSGNVIMSNSILWGNIASLEGPEVSGGRDGGNISVSYCCVQGGQWDAHANGGTLSWLDGNIEIDPVLANPADGDLHLKSAAGRWDPNASGWVYDTVTSPCIDAGDPTSDWAAELPPNGQRINMGAYGGTAEAGKSAAAVCIGDIDNSGTVDWSDLDLLVNMWLVAGLSFTEDLYADDIVNLKDLAVLVDYWGCSQ